MYRQLPLLLLLPLLHAADWAAWRGSSGSGSAAEGEAVRAVTSLEAIDLVWRSEAQLPDSYGGHGYMKSDSLDDLSGGYSSMAIVDGRIYLTFFRPASGVQIVDPEAPPPGITRNDNDYRRALLTIDADDHVLCIDEKTGKTIWERVFPSRTLNGNAVHKYNEFHTTPCVADGVVVVVGNTGRLYALDADSGEPLWERDSGPLARNIRLLKHYQIRSGGQRGPTKLVFDEEKLSAFLAGEQVPADDPADEFGPSFFASDRDRRGGSPGFATYMRSPQIVGDIVIVPTPHGLGAFRLRDGEELWRAGRGNKFASPLILRDLPKPLILQAGLRTLDPATGTVLDEAPFDGGYAPTPAISGSRVVVRAPLLDGADLPADLKEKPNPWTCYEVGSDGQFKLVWQAPAWASGWNYSCPAIYRGQVFVGVGARQPLPDHYDLPGERDRRGRWGGVVRLDLATGAVTGVVPWADINGGDARGIISSFAAGMGLVVLGDDSNTLHVFDAVGEEFRHLGGLETSFAAYTSPVIVDGHLFFREDNHVVCYDLQ